MRKCLAVLKFSAMLIVAFAATTAAAFPFDLRKSNSPFSYVLLDEDVVETTTDFEWEDCKQY